MTTSNTSAPWRPGTSTRPVRWRRLGAVSWRQYRLSAAGAAVFLGLLAAYLRFYYPFFAFAADSAFAPQYFELTGIAFAAWTLAAFAIGARAGVLIRKVVPAIAATMAVWAGLLLVTILYLRPHYQAPLTIRGQNVPEPSPWLIRQWWTGPNGQTITSENKIAELINHPQRGYAHDLAGPPPRGLNRPAAPPARAHRSGRAVGAREDKPVPRAAVPAPP